MIEAAKEIRYLNRNEIDPENWDRCIRESFNGLLYAHSYYLDAMAKNWSALIWDDYEIVMPLTWNRKYGIGYLYQPAFTAQLGVFSRNLLDKYIIEQFIQQAKSKFRFCEIHLNFANGAIESPMRTNYVLDLGKPYAEIRKGYKKRLLENLHEAEENHLQYLTSIDYTSTIKLFRKQYGKRFPHVRTSDYHHFENLCGDLHHRNMIFSREVKEESGELLNTSIFFRDHHRIYNIMSVSLPAGRGKRAHFYLLDRLIMEFELKKILLDFEGSEIPGIAEFYLKFGSINQPYPFLKFNQLPFPLKFFK